jgi:hypothetical protein
MKTSRLMNDEDSFLEHVKRESGRRVAASFRQVGGDVGHGLDLGPAVRKHPLLLTGSALAIGFFGAILARHHFRLTAERAAARRQQGGTPLSAGTRPAGRIGTGLMDLLLRDLVVPFVAEKAAGVMKSFESPRPTRPDAAEPNARA